jgi:phage shock protein PspC (stress-responsive transcriptional regulator)
MSTPKRLFRRSTSGRFGGVCAGLAEYMDADVTLVRFLWILLSIVPGGIVGGFIAYILAWFIMPDATDPPPALQTKRLTRSVADRRVAGVCAGLAEYFDLDPTLVRVLWAILAIVPGGIILGVVAYVIAWFIMPVPSEYPTVGAVAAV